MYPIPWVAGPGGGVGALTRVVPVRQLLRDGAGIEGMVVPVRQLLRDGAGIEGMAIPPR
jgi:hypothetical protein